MNYFVINGRSTGDKLASSRFHFRLHKAIFAAFCERSSSYFQGDSRQVGASIIKVDWFQQLRNPLLIYQNWKNAQQAEYAKKSAEIHAQLMATYRGYEQQHREFALHIQGQIAVLQQQIEADNRMKGWRFFFLLTWMLS